MNRAGVWATGSGIEADGAEALSGAEVVEAVLSWRDARGGNVLGRCEVRAGRSLTLGEGGDLMIPADVLGADRVTLLTFDAERALLQPPAGATLRVDGWAREEATVEVAAGHVVEVRLEAFTVRLSRTRAGTKIALAPLEGLRRGGAGILLGSALAHVAAFAVLAYVSPALAASEGDAYDRDNLELMQRMIDASAMRELENPPVAADDAPAGGTGPASQPAEGSEGQAGKDTPNKDGKWSARGTATPETATLAKAHELATAADFGAVGLLASINGELQGPTVTWGTVQNGADDVDHVGHLFGSTLGDAIGNGGWGLSGVGQGGGGVAQTIGLGNGIGVLGGTGSCTGGPCNGIGSGRGTLGKGYTPKFKGPRYGNPQTTGHLPAEVIQRIVRQNDGRYRFCYEQGLRTNPTLTGRVTVKFMIQRDGSVGIASDGGSDIPDGSVRQCVISSFTALSFPAPDSGIVTVYYPLTFTPQ